MARKSVTGAGVLVAKFKLTPITPTEHQIQSAFFEWCRLNERKYPELKHGMFSTMNGVRLPIGLAMKVKRQGAKKGTADVIFICLRRDKSGIAAEFKRPSSNSKLSPEQVDFLSYAESQNFVVHVWRTVDEAINATVRYLESK